jgi:hypothetical protein
MNTTGKKARKSRGNRYSCKRIRRQGNPNAPRYHRRNPDEARLARKRDAAKS